MIAIGNLVTYAVGSLDTRKIFGDALGNSQFKQMTIIAATSLLGSVLVTSVAVRERVLVTARDSEARPGVMTILTQLFRRTVRLPPRIRSICWVQFWSWIGWFPFMFYSTTWVGETYFRYEVPSSGMTLPEDALGEIGRLGSLSLMIYSVVTFVSSVVLPWCILSLDQAKAARTPRGMLRLCGRIDLVRPDLQTAWMLSNGVFAATMFWAPFARSLRIATLLVAICGVPWSVANWAPFAFMGVEINRLALSSSTPSSRTDKSSNAAVSMSASPVYNSRQRASVPPDARDPNDPDSDIELNVLRLNHRQDSIDPDLEEGESGSSSSSTGELAGIYLGVLNVYTTIPQFVGSIISWIVFSILEPPSRESQEPHDGQSGELMNLRREGPNAISVCLFIGAISAILAIEATRRLKMTK